MVNKINPSIYEDNFLTTPTGITISGATKQYPNISLMMSDPNPPKLAFVIDATADPTVTVGSALYIRNTTTNQWSKFYETESMDIQVSWSSILDKPLSSVLQIDNSVSNSHIHSNKTILDTVILNDKNYITISGQVLLPEDISNEYLSSNCYIRGSNNLSGGQTARIIAYNNTTRVITIINASNNNVWDTSLYQVGKYIYIRTSSLDENSYQKKLITNVDNNTSGILDCLDITLDSVIAISDGSSFDPSYVNYTFLARSLVTNGSVNYCKLVIDASTLKCVKNTVLKIEYQDGSAVSAYKVTWSNNTATILFSTAQDSRSNKVYRITTNSGHTNQPSFALIEFDEFEYTTMSDGEYNISSGNNSSVIGNGNSNIGDFSFITGIENVCVADNSFVYGVSNTLNSGSNITTYGVGNFVKGDGIFISGFSNIVLSDSSYTFGALNELYASNITCLGFSNRLYARGCFTLGSSNTHNTTAVDSISIGKRITNSASESTVLGVSGILPEYYGTLALDTQSYNTGDLSGVHCKGAIAFATGLGPSSVIDKTLISFIYTKYIWRKNPAYPWGTGDSSVVCPSAVGATSGITAATLRLTTLEDRILLEEYHQLQILAPIFTSNNIRIAMPNVIETNVAILDILKSNKFKIQCIDTNADGIATTTCQLLNWVDGDYARLFIYNGGLSFTFPSEWIMQGSIPALHNNGIDIFEIQKIDNSILYRYLYSKTN